MIHFGAAAYVGRYTGNGKIKRVMLFPPFLWLISKLLQVGGGGVLFKQTWSQTEKLPDAGRPGPPP